MVIVIAIVALVALVVLALYGLSHIFSVGVYSKLVALPLTVAGILFTVWLALFLLSFAGAPVAPPRI